MKKLSFLVFFYFSLFSFGQSIEGKWYGKIDIPNVIIDLELVFSEDKNELIVKQGASKESLKEFVFEMDSFDFSDNEVYFLVKSIGAPVEFKGELAEGDITGYWNQSFNSFPVTFNRKKEKPKPLFRPQSPIPPFDYYTEEIEAYNATDSVTLSGTLTLPTNDGKRYPVVILVTGSGPQNRDSEIFQHKSFAVIADHLAKRGIGSFRYDDRGVEKSTGTYAGSDLHHFYRDLGAVVQAVSERKEVKELGILGHSEGGILAPWYASEHKQEIDFVILLAAPGMPVRDMMHLQREFTYKGMGMNEEFIQEQKELFLGIDEIVLHNSGERKTKELKLYLTDYLSKKGLQGSGLEIEVQKIMSQVGGAWYKSFVYIHPEHYLKKLKCSVLAIGGGKDIQVPLEPNMKEIANALKQSRGKLFSQRTIQFCSFGKLNHLLQPADSGMPEEYAKIETTISREVLFAISDFIIKQ